MSTLTVRKQEKKDQSIMKQPVEDMAGEAAVDLDASHSPINKASESPEFQLDLDNDVSFQLSRQLVHLRRHRQMSQDQVANAVGTSQSHIARIENGEDNITSRTLERIIRALRGRLLVSIPPEEMPVNRIRHWWERPTNSWNRVFGMAVTAQASDGHNVALIIEGYEETTPKKWPLLLESKAR